MNDTTTFTLTYVNLFIKRDSLNEIIDYIIKEEVFKYNFEITEWDLFGSIKRQISSDIFKNKYFQSELQE